ncbi:hypothetical protein [Moorena producens]|nr:hypothetical protein [Moorena producens]
MEPLKAIGHRPRYGIYLWSRYAIAFPIPDSRFPIPDSRLPIPNSRK